MIYLGFGGQFKQRRTSPDLNPDCLKVFQTVAEPSLITEKAGDKFQFDRHEYMVAGRVGDVVGKRMFSLVVGLKGSWGR